MDTQELITALAEATCPNCVGHPQYYPGRLDNAPDCPTCSGTGLHPQTELLRMECDYWAHRHREDDKCYSKERCEEHRAACPGWGPATPEEAEAKGLALLEAFKLYLRHETYPHDGNHWVAGPAEGKSQRSATPLLAILHAMAQALNVEVGTAR